MDKKKFKAAEQFTLAANHLDMTLPKSYRISDTIKNETICIEGPFQFTSSSKIQVLDGGSLEIGPDCAVGPYASICTYGGHIKIGSNCSIQDFCMLYGHGNLTIGNHVSIAAQTIIIPANHNFEKRDTLICQQDISAEGIIIGNDVWIGAGSRILDGVSIGDGCVVGAGSVVTRSLPEYAVAVGCPAKVVKHRK